MMIICLVTKSVQASLKANHYTGFQINIHTISLLWWLSINIHVHVEGAQEIVDCSSDRPMINNIIVAIENEIF